MRKIVCIASMALIAGIAGAAAQSQTPRDTADQSGSSQAVTGATGSNNVPAPAKSDGRRNSGPPYSDCYLQCINAGNPADFCQSRKDGFCG